MSNSHRWKSIWFWPYSYSPIKWTKLKWAESHIYPGKLEIRILCCKYWNNVLVCFWNFFLNIMLYFTSSEIRFVPYFLFWVWNLQYFFPLMRKTFIISLRALELPHMHYRRRHLLSVLVLSSTSIPTVVCGAVCCLDRERYLKTLKQSWSRSCHLLEWNSKLC